MMGFRKKSNDLYESVPFEEKGGLLGVMSGETQKYSNHVVSVLCFGQNIRKLSETTGPTETKFHVAPPWDRGKDGKLIQLI